MREKIPSVSVIISVYNGEKYITECLESILSQTLKNVEIICVDDASTDSTSQILQKYQNILSIVTNPENCMAGVSRNNGFQVARGEYVIFLDADDLFEPCMLEKAYNKAKLYDADICIFKEDLFVRNWEQHSNYPYAETIMEWLDTKGSFSPTELREALFLLWNGWAWDKMFRREFIVQTNLQFQKLRTSNDGFFVHAAMASAKKITLCNEVLVHHRTGEAGSLSNTRDRAWESCLIYLRKLKEYLIDRDLFSLYEQSYINWSADFLYWNYRTLGEISRRSLADAMRQFFHADLLIEQYEAGFFYDAFLFWFVDCIVKGEENTLSLTESERYEITYRKNDIKLSSLHDYIIRQHHRAALWGAGVRGQAFARVHGTGWSELREVYDMDRKKHGKDVCAGLTIRDWDAARPDKASFVIVLNPAHLLAVYERLQEENVILFDMNTYLTLPYGIDECMLKCRQS